MRRNLAIGLVVLAAATVIALTIRFSQQSEDETIATSPKSTSEGTPPEAEAGLHSTSSQDAREVSDENHIESLRQISGRVINESERSVAGASVELTSYGELSIRVESDNNGEFSTMIPDSLPLVVITNADGYLQSSMTFRSFDSEIEIMLRRGSQVSGTVVSKDGPVSGARVAAGNSSTASGPGGVFVLENLPPGPVAIEAQYNNARSTPTKIDLSRGPVHGILLHLQDPGTLRVIVRSHQALPLAGADITVIPHGLDKKYEEKTDESGVAHFESVPAGMTRIVARAADMAAAETNANMPAGAEQDVYLQLSQAHAIVVNTVLEQGQPESSRPATIRLIPSDGSAPLESARHVQEARIGEPAVFQDLAEGEYRAIVHHPMYSSTPETARVPGPDITIVLEGGDSISGRVLDEDDIPIAGAFVIASPALDTSGDRTSLRPARRGRSDQQGYFEIMGVADGDWNLMPRMAGYTSASPIKAQPGDSAIVLRLSKTKQISGLVVDGRGVPMPSIRVVARSLFGERRRAARAATQDDGSFVIDGLSPGRYEVHAERSQRRSDALEVDAGGSPIRLIIPVGATIKGKPLGPDGRTPDSYNVLGFSFSEPVFELSDFDPRETIVWIEAPGLLRTEISVELQDDRVSDLGTIHLLAPAEVSGIVRTGSGKPAVGATIVLEVRDNGEAHPAITSANEEGFFSFSGLKLGQARLYAMSAEGESSEPAKFTLESGESKEVTLVVPKN